MQIAGRVGCGGGSGYVQERELPSQQLAEWEFLIRPQKAGDGILRSATPRPTRTDTQLGLPRRRRRSRAVSAGIARNGSGAERDDQRMSAEQLEASDLTGRHLNRTVVVNSEKELGFGGPEWFLRGALDQVTHRWRDGKIVVILEIAVEAGTTRQLLTVEVGASAMLEVYPG